MKFSKSTICFILIFLCVTSISYGNTNQELKLFDAVNFDNPDLKQTPVSIFLPSQNQFNTSLVETTYISAYLNYPAADPNSPNASKNVYLFHAYCGGATDFMGENNHDNSLLKFFRDQNYRVNVFDLFATVNLTEAQYPGRINEVPYDLPIIRDIFYHTIQTIETTQRESVNPSNIILAGHSMGSYFANAIAMQFKETTQTDIEGTFQLDPILPYPGNEAQNFVFELYGNIFNITKTLGYDGENRTNIAERIFKIASSVFNAPARLLLYEFLYDHTALHNHLEWPKRYANRLSNDIYLKMTCQLGDYMTTDQSTNLWNSHESDLKKSTFPTMIIWGKKDQVFKESHYRKKYAKLFLERENTKTVTYAVGNAGHYITAETLFNPVSRTGKLTSSDSTFIHETSDFHVFKLPSYRRLDENTAIFRHCGARTLYTPMLEFLHFIEMDYETN